jgi:hypothetical protein
MASVFDRASVNPCAYYGSGTGNSEDGSDDRPPETQVCVTSLPGPGGVVQGQAHQCCIKESEDDSDHELHG